MRLTLVALNESPSEKEGKLTPRKRVLYFHVPQ